MKSAVSGLKARERFNWDIANLLSVSFRPLPEPTPITLSRWTNDGAHVVEPTGKKGKAGMADAAGWVALFATCVAALMTASNLGARVTGWGFVIFTVGAAAWIVVGLATNQTQLLYSNIFLGLVDLFGIWRWLGRRARISDTAAAEVERSKQHSGENLFSLGSLDGLPVKSPSGDTIAYAVDALAACVGGRIDYLIVRAGGIEGLGETLHRLPWSEATIADGHVRANIDATGIASLPLAKPDKS